MKPTHYPTTITVAEAAEESLVHFDEKPLFGAIHRVMIDNLGNKILWEEIKEDKAPFHDVKLIIVWDMLYGASISGVIL